MLPHFDNLIELLQTKAHTKGEQNAFIFLADGESVSDQISYKELDRQAIQIATHLQSIGASGERVLLLYPAGIDFIAAFMGCLYAGALAVPSNLPRLNRKTSRLSSVVTDAEVNYAMSSPQLMDSLVKRYEHSPELAELHWVRQEAWQQADINDWQRPTISDETLAYLQYTSGSTSDPKGVMVTHGNLIHNLDLIAEAFSLTDGDNGAFWLPNYHDMGLIGGILGQLHCGGTGVLMPPTAFLQKPSRWLQAISDYRATIAGAPNFAFQLCCEQVSEDQQATMDLSSLKTMFSGAEPIQPASMARFVDRFASAGLPKESIHASYGLAEGTLIVSGGPLDLGTMTIHASLDALEQRRLEMTDGDSDRRIDIVSCGPPNGDQTIAIVDPDTFVPCPAGSIGEIWIKGQSVAAGYWQNTAATEETFHAYDTNGDGPYMRSGDLGFLHNGHLFVTGRSKDLLIIRGRNHYPNDIERTVEAAHPALQPSMGAAFSVTIDGAEKLIVAYELKRSQRNADVAEIGQAMRRAISLNHDLQLHKALFLRPLSIPKTSSGKVQRFACRKGYFDGSLRLIGEWEPGAAPIADSSDMDVMQSTQSAATIEAWLKQKIAPVAGVGHEQINIDAPFVDFGLDSLQATQLAADLETWLGVPLLPTLVWDYPSISQLAAFLSGSDSIQKPQLKQTNGGTKEQSIAIIGLSCRFPGAPSLDAFWELLRDGVDAIREVPADRWSADAYYEAGTPARGKMNTRYGGFLEGVDQFDAQFFGISPREAARLDPQQRLVLEVAWEALEHAGIVPQSLGGEPAGVYLGISGFDYATHLAGDDSQLDIYTGTGAAHSVAANRLSYFLDLRGPSVAIDTACSSSLVAIHMAVQALRNGDASLAVAGGVNLILAPDLTIGFSQANLMAPDGRCKTFDSAANGYVRSEGCGMLILKPLAEAEADGDFIYGVIEGSAVNQDGRSNGLTAPNGQAQQDVIRHALQDANVRPAAIGYVEAHGTGTQLGDPIEVSALRQLFGEDRPADQPLTIGSVKTNIGHLEAAAGVAGVIKSILTLHHETIPPHLHFNKANAHLTINDALMNLTTSAKPWQRHDQPRRIGVSSFGFGGTNAHIVLREGAPLPAVVEADSQHLFTLSARSETALQALAQRYIDYLPSAATVPLCAISATANTRRHLFDHRLAVAASTKKELAGHLSKFIAGRRAIGLSHGQVTKRRPRIGFLFSSPGAQYVGMGRQLYEQQPVFRATIDECAELIAPYLDIPLKQILYPAADEGNQARLKRLTYSQPALFATEYALVMQWRAWGVEPDFVMGHSMGEYVAACVAGIMSLEDGLRLIAERGRLMDSAPIAGMMAAVHTSEAKLSSYLRPYSSDVSIGAINGRENLVLSGSEESVERVLVELEVHGISVTRLPISQASHSPLMEVIMDPLFELANSFKFNQPSIPFVSSMTGHRMENGHGASAEHWRQHLRQPVRFQSALETLVDEGIDIFIEIGPNPSLISFGRRGISTDRALQWLPSLRQNKDDNAVMLRALGHLHTAGYPIKWPQLLGENRPVPLPTYPFERQRYWIDPPARQTQPATASITQRANGIERIDSPIPLFQTSFANGVAVETEAVRLIQQAAKLYWGDGEVTTSLFELSDATLQIEQPAPAQIILSNTTADEAAATLHLQLQGNWVQLCQTQLHWIAGDPNDADSSENLSLREQLLALSHEERTEQLATFLTDESAHILGLNMDGLGSDIPLTSLGLDSLMAMELRHLLERRLQVEIAVAQLLQGISVHDLTLDVITKMSQPLAAKKPIVRVADPAETHPLSNNQLAFWYLKQLLPADTSFNVASAVNIHGPLNVAALETAFQRLCSRHDILKTTYHITAGVPQQQVQPDLIADFQFLDATDWSQSQIQSFLSPQAYGPFDLEREAPVRMRILRRGNDEHILLLAMDHIVTDLQSSAIIVHELYQLYEAACYGTELILPALPLRVADYAYWEAEMLQGTEGERQRLYWRKQLGGQLPILDLPTDHPRQATQTFNGERVVEFVDSELTSGLRKVGREHQATLYMTLMAAFHTFLYRYTNQEDMIVGTVLTGRDRSELAPLVGYFIKPLAIRSDFSDSPSFGSLLTQVRQTMLDAFIHQDYPLLLLANQLDVQFDPSRTPVFQTMFIMEKGQRMGGGDLSPFALGIEGAHLTLGELELHSIHLDHQPAQFDLTLMVAELDEGLAITFHYNSDLFENDTAAEMLKHFVQLLESIGLDANRPVTQLPLLSPSSPPQPAAAPQAEPQLIHDLFTKQADATPNAIAVCDDYRQLSYAELDKRSNQLATHLQKQGVGPETLVGLYLDRSVDMLVGLLGILKAGGAYIPMDPSFPQSRIATMLEDGQPSAIVTQHAQLESLTNIAGDSAIICLDKGERWQSESDALPVSNVSAENLAYVIFTSGSTGRPKGVQVQHNNVTNFLASMQQSPGMSSTDRLLAVTTISFDIAVLELFLPLVCGATVAIASRETATDGFALAEQIAAVAPTIMQATPSTWQMLLAAGWQGHPNMRVLCGGEALPRELANSLLGKGMPLWNMYGPTETTIWSAIHPVTAGEGSVPLGDPIASTTLHVVDERGELVPQGVVGELVIGGEGVTRGYLNRPDLTHERFMTPRWASNPTERIYRTGDLVRNRPDGSIQFLGRNDHQIKIRGYRVELGDIEAALQSHPAIATPLVVARDTAAGDRQLIGYYVATSEMDAPSYSDLRTHLREQLPDYMIPATFMQLDTIPLTPNGKIDRKGLPAPELTRPDLFVDFVPPSTRLERKLVALCSELLGMAQVGIHDNFFELGGSSLMATRFIFLIQETFEAKIVLRDFFAQPTVFGIAQLLEPAMGQQADRHYADDAAGVMTVDQLNAEVALDDTICTADLPPALQLTEVDRLDPQHVLLTGVTGFVGAFLLCDLLRETSATVHCLVRAASITAGTARIRKNMEMYGLWDDAIQERLVVIPGDFSRPRFGLDRAAFDALAETIDLIYHNGSQVNLVYPYQALKGTNVLGTEELLRLATRTTLKPVHYVSTLSVLHTGAHDDGKVYYEDVPLDKVGAPYGGYAQSKWVAEKLIMAAGERGIPTAIYRPGVISGDSRNGAGNPTDLMSTLVQSSLAMGTAPDLDVMVDLVPVNYVSSAIVELSLRPDGHGRVYHLSNPERMSYKRVMDWAASQGYKMKLVPFTEWRDDLSRLASQFGRHENVPYLTLLEDVDAEQVFMPAFDCQNVVERLATTQIRCEPVTENLMATYFQHLSKTLKTNDEPHQQNGLHPSANGNH